MSPRARPEEGNGLKVRNVTRKRGRIFYRCLPLVKNPSKRRQKGGESASLQGLSRTLRDTYLRRVKTNGTRSAQCRFQNGCRMDVCSVR